MGEQIKVTTEKLLEKEAVMKQTALEAQRTYMEAVKELSHLEGCFEGGIQKEIAKRLKGMQESAFEELIWQLEKLVQLAGEYEEAERKNELITGTD